MARYELVASGRLPGVEDRAGRYVGDGGGRSQRRLPRVGRLVLVHW
jgi:hypothetical protein